MDERPPTTEDDTRQDDVATKQDGGGQSHQLPCSLRIANICHLLFGEGLRLHGFESSNNDGGTGREGVSKDEGTSKDKGAGRSTWTSILDYVNYTSNEWSVRRLSRGLTTGLQGKVKVVLGSPSLRIFFSEESRKKGCFRPPDRNRQVRDWKNLRALGDDEEVLFDLVTEKNGSEAEELQPRTFIRRRGNRVEKRCQAKGGDILTR
ncbi:hypothetical protein CAEBREN_01792 [Caenorhabditis brenneri]|uniref:Uncharacterized protein n=1 Tax=Caenorhabditis brenneri TaxID=135651 RepID=G0N7H5_CAEBE|nr:hypothetical protein CAEBREN_01792 [Caenorhabditis brenneri]